MTNDPETTTNETDVEHDDPGSKTAEKGEGEGQPLPCGKDEIWDPVQQKCVPRTK